MEKYDGYWSADRNKLVNSFTGEEVKDVFLYARKQDNFLDNLGGIIFVLADRAQEENKSKMIKISFGIETIHMLHNSNFYEWDDCTFLDDRYKPAKFWGAVRNPDNRNGIVQILCDGKVCYEIKILDLDVYYKLNPLDNNNI